MVVPIRKQMDDFDKKMDEMQKSIELIARHVKHEIDDVKKTLPEAELGALGDYQKKVSSLESQVNGVAKELKDQLQALQTQLKESQLKQVLELKKAHETGKQGKAEDVEKISAEVSHIKSQLSSMPDELVKHFERRLTDETGRFKEFTADIHDSISKDLERRVAETTARIEKLSARAAADAVRGVDSEIKNEMKSTIRQAREDIESLKRELKEGQLKNALEAKKAVPSERTEKIEKQFNEEVGRLEGFISDSNRAISENMEKRVAEEITRLEEFVSDSNKIVSEEIEQKLQQEISRLEDLVYNSGRLLTEKGMEEYLLRINKLKANLERYVNVKVQLLETRINELSETIKTIEGARDYLNIDEKLASLESRLNTDMTDMKRTVRILGNEEEIQALKRKMSQFASEHEINDIKSTVNDMRIALKKLVPESESVGIENAVIKFKNDMDEIKRGINKFVPEAELVGLEGALKSLREKLDVFESADEFKKFKESMQAHLFAEDAAIAETRQRLEENMKKLTLDFGLKINQMKRAVEQETEKFKDIVNEQEIQELRNELEELRHSIDNEHTFRLSLEKNMDDLEGTIKNFNVADEIATLKQSVDEESANRLSMDKKLADMEVAVGNIKNTFASMGKLEHLDFEKVEQEISSFRESLKNTERDQHLKVVNIVTEQLNEFSKALDKRLPDLMTRDEFEKNLGEIKAKIQNVEAPDLTPLAFRVEQLERQIMNISNMMQSVYNRLPIVVE